MSAAGPQDSPPPPPLPTPSAWVRWYHDADTDTPINRRESCASALRDIAVRLDLDALLEPATDDDADAVSLCAEWTRWAAHAAAPDAPRLVHTTDLPPYGYSAVSSRAAGPASATRSRSLRSLVRRGHELTALWEAGHRPPLSGAEPDALFQCVEKCAQCLILPPDTGGAAAVAATEAPGAGAAAALGFDLVHSAVAAGYPTAAHLAGGILDDYADRLRRHLATLPPDRARACLCALAASVAGVRALVPRLYLQSTLCALRGDGDGFGRVRAACAGVGDPLAAVHLRARLCRVAEGLWDAEGARAAAAGLCRDQLGHVRAGAARRREAPDPLSSGGLWRAQAGAAAQLLGTGVEGMEPQEVREFAGYLMRCTKAMP